MGAQDAGRSCCFTGHAADQFLRLNLYLRGGDIFKGKSNLASSARKQRSASYWTIKSLSFWRSNSMSRLCFDI